MTKPPINLKFFLWGLHARPEGSVLVLGRGKDEIDELLKCAKMLPEGCVLIVKENPEMFGLRDLFFYRKLESAKNILLADPFSATWDFLENSSGVLGISGTLLLEAEILGKPAFAIGEPEFYGILAGSKGKDLSVFLSQTLANHHVASREAVIAYIALVIKDTITQDLYSENKPNQSLTLTQIIESPENQSGINDVAKCFYKYVSALK
jgi:hypothetical protein